jgi:pre-mRNA-splicing factor SPF27
MALRAPRTEIDALPYVDHQYNEERMRKRVEALINAELKTFAPRSDALAHLPLREPNFDRHPMLAAEWLRVNAQEPMPTIDVSRYQLDPPTKAKQGDRAAWDHAVQNAQAQLEHQGTRLDNLELLQQHGPNLWLAHINGLESASKRLASEHAELSQSIELLNRTRKVEQTELGPKLARLEGGWVAGVKKNLEIEALCMGLEQQITTLKRRLDPTAQ